MSITFRLSMSISMIMRHEVKLDLEYSLIKFNSITINFSITLTYSYIISISNGITDINTVIVLQYYDYYNC